MRQRTGSDEPALLRKGIEQLRSEQLAVQRISGEQLCMAVNGHGIVLLRAEATRNGKALLRKGTA